ncbi:MAG: hypothetical protein GX859_09785 [Corynebacterium humireducens]|uniref:Uncharacterized protein n=1 Tax=Corynebacterium humireducens TaxID=1223514 RepID=A0A7X6PP59_9CORY|nr:hypothetical protein [Corynebacterium humireducens]
MSVAHAQNINDLRDGIKVVNEGVKVANQGVNLLNQVSSTSSARGGAVSKVATSTEYKQGSPIHNVRTKSDDFTGPSDAALGGVIYANSVYTTGSFSGWGTRYLTIYNDGELTGVGAVMGLGTKELRRASPIPARANLDIFEDGNLVAQERFSAGDVKYVEHTFSPGATSVSFVVTGFDAQNQEMNAHGGFILGDLRVW